MKQSANRMLCILIFLPAVLGLYKRQTLSAQNRKVDTTKVYTIPQVTISDMYHSQDVKSALPLQTLNSEQLKRMQILQLSDAVKHFAGVTVKDYGGIGGLKTVSLRSLGAEHTAVAYDGIALTDCQTGQIDIGRFSIENVDKLSLSNGQADNIFQPARFFASAGLLNIQTLTPLFNEGEHTHLNIGCKTGSWGFFNPTIRIEQRLSERWLLTFNGEWMRTDGQYPFILKYGGDNDSTSHEKRTNTEVNNVHAEVELLANLSSQEQWRTKVYYYSASRGLPNATTLYYDYTAQHLWDKNVFVQTSYKKDFNTHWAMQTAAKWNWAYERYLDPDYKGVEQKLENTYYQWEYYLTASALYRVMQGLSFSASIDGSINKLNANTANFAYPERYTWLSAVAGKYKNDWLTASASLLATVINDKVRQGESGGNKQKLTPEISLSLKPFSNEELRMRFFYKKIFRMPTFNDLYYGQIGNTNLLPETAEQFNAGLTFSKKVRGWITYLAITADCYYNKVSDKIIATPTKNLFVWSMINLGKVEIKGIDVTGEMTIHPAKEWNILLSVNTTYQKALDKTNPADKVYNQQIAYTPRYTGSGMATLETPWCSLTYSLVYAGKRYILGQNISENRMNAYTDQSVGINKKLEWKSCKADVSVEILNLSNKNYEIVKNFPMPGRSFRASIRVMF